MADQYTDRFGYPLTSSEILRRLQSPKSAGYYDKDGVWRQRRVNTARTPPATKPKEVK